MCYYHRRFRRTVRKCAPGLGHMTESRKIEESKYRMVEIPKLETPKQREQVETATLNVSVYAEGLRKRRNGLRSRIGRLLENVERFISEGQAETEFELCLTDQDLQDHELQDSVDLELAVVKAKTMAKAAGKRKEQAATAVAPEQCAVRGPNLPEWQLPKFAGDVLEFPSFWDQFQAGVHGREALEAISGFHVINANYPTVIQTLKDRFGREEIIVEGRVLALLPMTRADPGQAGIRSLYYNLNRHLRALSAMGKGIDNGLTAGDIFVASFKQLLPHPSRKRWEQRTRTCANAKTDTSAFLSFLHE
ncbi:hypothetical protein M514_09499 [Trichuris suis]|uniref:Uncharacterized protein n=1 Tax=Trichuris suis TaxID=68888 RepID=A0A085NA31_9BILA|nr:hypothetical protein M513_09499 [Trichuris suis]KFD66327.1 hypothetical protein M514_09499 [Trichuris suis]